MQITTRLFGLFHTRHDFSPKVFKAFHEFFFRGRRLMVVRFVDSVGYHLHTGGAVSEMPLRVPVQASENRVSDHYGPQSRTYFPHRR
jgi:hypothetical protein